MTYDVVVVGAGAAGLTSAAYASRAGLSVLLLEKQERLGGLVQSVVRNGFTFDLGLRAVENSGILLPMFEDLGITMEFVKSTVSIGIEHEVMTVTSKDSVETYRRFLESFFPKSSEDIHRIIEVVKRIMKDMDVLYGIDNPIFKDLRTDHDYLLKEMLPWMFKFVFTIGRINRMNEPVERLLDRLSDNPSLKSIIGQHFFRNTPAFFAMSYFSVYLDYLYPKGGTATITRLLEDYLRRKHVDIETGSTVKAVDPESRLVTTEQRKEYHYRSLIWCADLKMLYASIDAETVSDRALRKTLESTRDYYSRFRGGDSVFSLFLSVDETPEYFRSISEGHFFYNPDARGMVALHTAELSKLMAGAESGYAFATRAKEYLAQFFQRNTYEISIPVLKDSSMAPESKTGLIVSCLFDYSLLKKISDDGWYEECKDHCRETILNVLDGSIYPGLKDKVIDSFVSTPLSIERRTGSSEGAITGWAFTGGTMPVINKMQKVSRSVITPLDHVYQAGQWVYSPGGLPMSLLTGKLAANRVIKELKSRSARTGEARSR